MSDHKPTQSKPSSCPDWLISMGILLPPLLFIAMVVWTTRPKERGSEGVVRASGASRSAPALPPGTENTRGSVALVSVKGSATKGEEIYNNFCIACHQAGGEGKVGFAPFIRNPHFLALTTDDFLRKSIVNGRPGTAMTPWAHLKPVEIESLVAYLRSGEDSRIKAVASVDPARKHPGDALSGKPLYTQYCASCHGPEAHGYAEGGPGPAIGNSGFLAVASDDYIFQTVKHGRPGTAMRAFSGSRGLANLADREIADIIAHLRSGVAPSPAIATSEPDLVKGKTHFEANCAACHQADGAGRAGIAPSIGNRDFLALASDEFIKETVRNGRPGTSMVQRPDLSDQVLTDMIAYLRSLPVENVVKIEVDPDKNLAARGNQEQGHEKFGLYCAACHGPKGQGYIGGGAGPGIGLSGFLNAASDDYIFQTLKQGRINTAMRSFLGASGLANLNEQDAYDIIAYMRSLSASGQ